MVTRILNPTGNDVFTPNDEQKSHIGNLKDELSTRIDALKETYDTRDRKLLALLKQAKENVSDLVTSLDPNYRAEDKNAFNKAHNLSDDATEDEIKQACESSPIYAEYLKGVRRLEELLIFLSHDARTNTQSAYALCKIIARAKGNTNIAGNDDLTQSINTHVAKIKPAPFSDFYQNITSSTPGTEQQKLEAYSTALVRNYRLLLRDLDDALEVSVFENGKYAWERGVTAENIRPNIPNYKHAEQVPKRDVIVNSKRHEELRHSPGIFGIERKVRGPDPDAFVDRYKGYVNQKTGDGKIVPKQVTIVNLSAYETRLRSEDAGIDPGVAYLRKVGLHEEAHYRGWTMTIDTMVKAVDFKENLEQNSLTQKDENGRIVGHLVPVTAKEVVTTSSGQQEVVEATKWVLISKDVYNSWTKELDGCIRSYERSGFDIATERERLKSHRERVAVLDETVAAQEDWINVLRAANGLRTLEKDILEQIPENERGTYIDILKGLLTSYEQFSQHFREHTYYSAYARNIAREIGNSIPGFNQAHVQKLAEQHAAEIHEELKELYLKYASEILYLLKNTQLSQKDLEQLLLNIDTELKRRVKTLEFKRLFGLNNDGAIDKANALIPLRQEQVSTIAGTDATTSTTAELTQNDLAKLEIFRTLLTDDALKRLAAGDNGHLFNRASSLLGRDSVDKATFLQLIEHFKESIRLAKAEEFFSKMFTDSLLSVDESSIKGPSLQFTNINRMLKELGIREISIEEFRLLFAKIKGVRVAERLEQQLTAEKARGEQAEKMIADLRKQIKNAEANGDNSQRIAELQQQLREALSTAEEFAQRGQSEQGHKTKSRVDTAEAQEAALEFSSANDIIDYISKSNFVDQIELAQILQGLKSISTKKDLETIANEFLARHKKNIDTIYEKYGSNITVQDVMEAFIKRYGLQLADFDDDDLGLNVGGAVQTIGDPQEGPKTEDVVIEPKGTNLSPEIQAKVESFVSAIQEWDVIGKLPKGSTVKGTLTNRSGAYYHYGEKEFKMSLRFQSFESLYTVSERAYPEVHALALKTHAVTVERDPANQNNSIIWVSFHQDTSAVDNRKKHTVAHVAVIMPSNKAKDFINTIKNEPDALEEFYKRAFPELDAEKDRPGAKRLRAGEFILLQQPQLDEIATLDLDDRNAVTNTFNNLPRYTYKNGPYGVVEAI